MGFVAQAHPRAGQSVRTSLDSEAPAPAVGLVTAPPARRRNRGRKPVAVLRIARLWPSSKRQAAPDAVDAEGLDAFSPETGASTPPAAVRAPQKVAAPSPGPRPKRNIWIPVTGVVLAAAIGAGVYYVRKHPIVWPWSQGSVAFETAPAGIDVFIAGKSVGRTPVKVSLPPGSYDVRLGTGASAREFSVSVSSGASVLQHYEMAPAVAAPAPVNGSLRLQTEPAHQVLLVDGVERGPSPLTLDNLSAGDHEIAVRGERGLTKRTVHVTAGQATDVILTAAPSAAEAPALTAGWLNVTSPIALQVREGGRLIGSSDVDKLMMSSGDHTVELVSDTFGFRTQKTVKITAGKTAGLKIEVPNGTMNLNALPWAEVFVDGARVGQTPIGNLSLPIGRHEVLFRHPTLGERREVVNVTAQQTARLGVDLRK